MTDDHTPDDPFAAPYQTHRIPVVSFPIVEPMVRMRGARVAVVEVPLSAFALDIALYPDALEDVGRTWGVTKKVIERTLATNRMLADAVNGMKREIEAGGPVRVKARQILEGLLPRLEVTAIDPLTPPRDKIKTIQLIAELADALPRNDTSQNTGGNVFNFTFGNLMEAAQNAPPPLYRSSSGPVIDVQPLGEEDEV